MNKDESSKPIFSLVADFSGDIAELFNKEPGDRMPILPLRDMMLFPGVVAPVSVSRDASRKIVMQAAEKEDYIGVVCQKDPSINSPKRDDLYHTGVIAKVIKIIDMPTMNAEGGMKDGNPNPITVILQAFSRFQLGEVTRNTPFMRAKVEHLTEEIPPENDREFIALVEACKEVLTKLIRHSNGAMEMMQHTLKNVSNPVFFINFLCTNISIPIEEKAKLLLKGNMKERTYALLEHLNKELQYAILRSQIQDRTRSELDEQQKEYFLNQQIKVIQDELGHSESNDINELRKKALEVEMPEKVAAVFHKELDKLGHINPQSPDYNVQLNYLQTLLSLPWNRMTADNLDIPSAAKTLNHDHYGMEKVKERILEHLAVLKFRQEMKSPILCLYGPPGVGKTSLGKSIARALGRKYVRISLGGMHDEAEIRGHRRTYVGAMPGRIIKGLIKAESNNPVFILDEIDKVSENNFNGDPQSALLEVLDPEQNNSFHDNFLDMDYDLSHVMFIATANNPGTIPAPLRDRMEMIEVGGYLNEEKLEIAKRHLIVRAKNNITLPYPLKFSPKAIETIIEQYTRESGVRQLEKQIEKMFRKVAYRTAVDGIMPFYDRNVKPKDITEYLGKPVYSRDLYQGNDDAGVVTGLAWTAVGGEILFIETSLSRSKAPRLTLTGNLGDVMKESATLAFEYIKAHAEELGIDYRIFEEWSLHIHVPEGATPKDGPSAGITMATSIASALTQRKIRKALAMTGEITLRGKVLPVGGIKEKILAAKRSGITTIIMCKENRRDVEDVKPEYVAGLDFIYVENVMEVLDHALLDEKPAHPKVWTVTEKETAPTALSAAKA